MDNLQSLLDKQWNEIPRMLLRDLITKKLCSQNLDAKPDLVDRIVEHALSGNPEPFVWEQENSIDLNLNLSVSEEDIAEAEQKISHLLGALPNIIDEVSTSTSKSVLKDLKKRWGAEYSLQLREHRGFVTAQPGIGLR